MLSQLQQYDFYSMHDHLPPNGVYFFFERGKTIQFGTTMCERVTRIGTHIKPGRLPNRIQQHFGNKNSPRGNKNSSVFRIHLGAALLIRHNPNDSRIEKWGKQGGNSDPKVEAQVSRLLRDDFSFVCIPVNDYDDRKTLSRGLIALLAQMPMGSPSDTWLGRFSNSEAIQQSGLWNVEHVNAEPLGAREFNNILASKD